RSWFKPNDLREAVFAYLERPGKRLRPAVLMWSCGAVGGNEDSVLPAAAAVEVFHTWTLVHDDLIDNDDLRRGGPTIHKLGETIAAQRMGFNAQNSKDYGRDLAVLTGDSQHGFTISLLCECARSSAIDPYVVLDVIYHLESYVVNTLLEGEILDVQYSFRAIEELTEQDIMRMLWMKTGALYEFAARTGAMLGLNTRSSEHPWVASLSRFASSCGTAFQLQDDILGIVGSESQLGKPVGSDIREGKKTIIVLQALKNASEEEQRFLKSVLGNSNASGEEVKKAADIMVQVGAVEETARMARQYIDTAMKELEALPDSRYKQLLAAWAQYMIEREF
ncbi:MAG: polyprenyl synthetase family protein, partial [Armatimonadota bacterium]|nr:polyprenyl synthetase family protein [Armatimonadota bacterium]